MQAKQQISRTTDFDWNDVSDFRKKRNEIIHYGFSPKDDERSAILLLSAGVPLIERCYECFFNFHLKGSEEEFGGLLPNLDWHLNIAQRVYSKAKEIDGVDLTYCFRSFAHDIRWGINRWMLSDWQKSALGKEEDSGWFSWEFKEQQKKDLESGFETPWSFSCPVCEETDAFIAELDDHALTEGNIRLKKGACANCSLLIPTNCPFLADELCMDQILEAKPKILKEYRIEEC